MATLVPIPSPILGLDAHSVASLQPTLDAIAANLNTLNAAVVQVNADFTGGSTENLQPGVPDEAKIGDKWFKTDNADPSLVTVIEGFVNTIPYLITDGLDVPTKESRWKEAQDAATKATVASLSSTVDGKIALVQGTIPQPSADIGDLWIDTTVSNENQVYTAKIVYDFTGNTPFQTPSGASATWSQPEIDTHFFKSGDKNAIVAAGLAQGTADGKRTGYWDDRMPGINIELTTEFEVGDTWLEDVSPAYQGYMCFLGYNGADIPADEPSRVTFQLDHWQKKGDKSAQDAAAAAQATADSKIETFRQNTTPLEADILDFWVQTFSPPDDDEQIFNQCLQAYDDVFIQANYVTEGFLTAEAFRFSLWQVITDANLIAAINTVDAAKSVNKFTTVPADKGAFGDTWTDNSVSPALSYNLTVEYDFTGETFSWIKLGVNDPPTGGSTPLTTFYWELVSIEAFADIASDAKAVADGRRSTFTGPSVPDNSGIVDTSTTSNFRPVDIGDLWVNLNAELEDDDAQRFTIWVCFRSYENVPGLDFVGIGPDRDGSNNLLNPGDGGFNTNNAFNYWQQTRDQSALEFAIDIVALQDGKRNTFISNSTDADITYPVFNDTHSGGIPDASITQGGISIGDIWIDEGSSAPDDTFQVYKCLRAYAYDDTDPGERFLSIGTNWLAVSELGLRNIAIQRFAFIDNKREVFVNTTIPNPGVGAPATWKDLRGALIGDIWIDTSVSPALLRYCKVAYLLGGTTGTNWESMDEVGTPINPSDPASKGYVDDNFVPAAGGSFGGDVDITRNSPVFTLDATSGTLGKMVFERDNVVKGALELESPDDFLTFTSVDNDIALDIETGKRIRQTTNPLAADEVANKGYADSLVSGGPFVPESGGTFSGTIRIDNNVGESALVLDDQGGANTGLFRINAGGTFAFDVERKSNALYPVIVTGDNVVALDLAGKRLVNVAAATSGTDGVRLDQMETAIAAVSDLNTGQDTAVGSTTTDAISTFKTLASAIVTGIGKPSAVAVCHLRWKRTGVDSFNCHMFKSAGGTVWACTFANDAGLLSTAGLLTDDGANQLALGVREFRVLWVSDNQVDFQFRNTAGSTIITDIAGTFLKIDE